MMFFVGSNLESYILTKRKEEMSTVEGLRKLFIHKFDFNIEELRLETTLEDLGLDSLDKIEFMFDIENEFNIKIPDQEFKVITIQDMVDAVDRFILEQKGGSLSPEKISKT